MTTESMRIAGWIPRATNIHSEYVILIDFPLLQWLSERALVLRYTYSTMPVLISSHTYQRETLVTTF